MKKKVQDPREPNIENVGVNKELIARIKANKNETGVSIRFFVEQAIEEKFFRQNAKNKIA